MPPSRLWRPSDCARSTGRVGFSGRGTIRDGTSRTRPTAPRISPTRAHTLATLTHRPLLACSHWIHHHIRRRSALITNVESNTPFALRLTHSLPLLITTQLAAGPASSCTWSKAYQSIATSLPPLAFALLAPRNHDSALSLAPCLPLFWLAGLLHAPSMSEWGQPLVQNVVTFVSCVGAKRSIGIIGRQARRKKAPCGRALPCTSKSRPVGYS